jgi:hypothetical protein
LLKTNNSLDKVRGSFKTPSPESGEGWGEGWTGGFSEKFPGDSPLTRPLPKGERGFETGF